MFGPYNDTTLKYIRRWIGTAAQQASMAKDEVETTEKTELLKHLQSMRDCMVIYNAWVHKPNLQKGLEGFNKSFRALECFIQEDPVIKFDCDYWHEFLLTVQCQSSGLAVLTRLEIGHLQTMFHGDSTFITDMQMKFLRLVCANTISRESKARGAVTVVKIWLLSAILHPSPSR